MPEWESYTLVDFLMFAPRTYYRLFELYNREIWPLQLVALALGLALPVLLRWRVRWHAGAVTLILAAAWAWIAWGFHWRHYATINWPAEWFAAGFALQAALLLGLGRRLRLPSAWHPADTVAYAVLLFALLLLPLIGPLLGRPSAQVELFGVAPDPTAVATLAVLALTAGPARWLLLPIPLLWCAVGGATLWAMQAPDAALMPLAGMAALLAALWRQEPRREGRGSADTP